MINRYQFSTLIILGLILSTGLLSCIPLSDSKGRPLINTDHGSAPEPEPEIVIPVRPDNLFRIKSNYCLCQEGKTAMALTANHCTNTCAEISGDGNQNILLAGEVEIASFEVNISHEHFQGDLYNFCHLLLDPINDKNPGCVGRVNELHNSRPEFNLPETAIDFYENNRFQVTFNNELRENKIYSFRIQANSEYTHPVTGEISSIIGHTSFIQFKVKSPEEPHDFGGQLKVGTAKRFYCISTNTSNGPNGEKIEKIFKQHFFFDAATTPPIIPASVSHIYCHDKDSSTEENGADGPLVPRLGEAVAFKLWDKIDRRFYRNNSDSDKESDINEFIKIRLREKHGFTTQGNIALFNPLELPSFSITAGDAPQKIDNLTGFYLSAFVDPDGGFPICPNEFDLRRPQTDEKFEPQFDVLREFIHATEALYVALRTPRQFYPVNDNPIDDVLFINESLVKEIWFYRDDSNRLQFLDAKSKDFENLVSSKAVYFYWPADPVAPTVKKGFQELYQILSPQELQQEISGSTQNNNNSDLGPAPLADRRIGCIPKS